MFSKVNRETAIAAALALLLTPVAANYPQELKDTKLRQCDASVKLNDVADMGTFWGSDAEKFADDYIKAQNDHSQWAQNLYRDLFPKETASNFDCMGPDTKCFFVPKCEDFNAIDKGSLYYLFISMTNFHTYMVALRNEMNFAFVQNSLSVSTIQEILQLPDGKADEPLNIFNILSGTAATAAAIPLNPAWQGAASAASGIFAIVGEIAPQPEAIDVTGKATAAINDLIAKSAQRTNEVIASLLGAVFGSQGQSQDVIPESMRRGEVTNPAVSVFGWGAWLQDNGGATAAATLVKTMKAKADQSLLWQMARLFKRTYVLVRPDLDASECTDAVNAWDGDKNQCYTLHSWDGTTSGTLGGANDLGGMWGRWNMDPMWTMRNAVECWEAKDGNIGEASISQGWTSDAPPPCFFAMTVLKGSYSDIQKGTLWLDGNFAGQKGMQDKLWPKNKCDEALELGAEECQYEWKE